MTNFENLQEELYERLKLTNSVSIVNESDKQVLGYEKNLPLWKVSIEVPAKERILEFEVIVQFKNDFPVSLPRIFLQKSEYEPIKYLPHVESNLKICLFDQENIKQDIDRPFEILKTSLNQAAKVLSEGIDKKNDNDFLDEIVAYWNLEYDKNDRISAGYTGSEIQNIQIGSLPAYWIEPSYTNVNVLLLPENEKNKKLLKFFKEKGHKIDQIEAFYLGEVIDLKPPFFFKNLEFYEFIRSQFTNIFTDFKNFFNKGNNRKLVVFSIRVNNTLVLFAFFFYPFPLKLNGWRNQSLKPISLVTQVKPNEPVNRLSFQAFEQNRLLMRTDGVKYNDYDVKITVIGLGSIGSHLIEYLNEMAISTYHLVDPEDLTLENVNRHLLSYYDVGYSKVDGISMYLRSHNPFITCKTSKSSIIELIKRDHECLHSDVIFCVVGKDAVEDFILKYIADRRINHPLVIMWIEPFLIGGHLLYVLPGTRLKMRDLEIDGFYKYNIISSNTYNDKNNDLLLKEAGCQGSYIPYSKLAIRQYFSSILPFLKTIIRVPPIQNTVVTYVGDIDDAYRRGFSLSPLATESFRLIMNSL